MDDNDMDDEVKVEEKPKTRRTRRTKEQIEAEAAMQKIATTGSSKVREKDTADSSFSITDLVRANISPQLYTEFDEACEILARVKPHLNFTDKDLLDCVTIHSIRLANSKGRKGG
jgi:hypothetical protein